MRRATQKKASALEIGRRLLQVRLRRHNPVYLIHSLTSRCNAKCPFCAWAFYDDDDAKEELSTEEIKALYRDARKAGFLALSVWGGEPLIHRDVGELMRYAGELGLRTHMVTNGALLKKKADQVMPHLDRVCISVDHPSDRHDEMRGIPGLYGRIMDATRDIRRRYPDKKIIYVYTFQKSNVAPADIEYMAEVMRGLDVVGVFNAMRLESANNDPDGMDLEQYNPSREELSEAFRTVRDLKKRGFPVVNSYHHLDMMKQGPPVYSCHWPKFFLPVESNGDVVDCMHWGTRPMGNIRETPFSELLDHPRLRALCGAEGEACHKCVSIHRVDISEIWNGGLEPMVSWARGI